MSHLFRLFMTAGLVAFCIIVIAVGFAKNTSALMAPFNLLLFLALVALYVAPTALALYRNCKATKCILALNILLGWTFFGWVIALGWAAKGKISVMHPPLSSPPGPALEGH